jgi:thioredoxin reductase/pSer/pThr/pTyr-binding forkhead associated (FHA) protein/ferredoxin
MSDAPDASESDYTTFGTLKVEQATPPPDVFDVAVAGGGPGGTAAAMRAHELGLSTLVLEVDDLLREIRDFGPEKWVEPDYGVRADTNPLPPGGPLVTALHFDRILAGDLLARWRQAYKQHNVRARIGIEFTGLERGADGVWTVRGWSHRARQDLTYRARNVIVAIGGSVPRRFDIPGNLDGIRFRLGASAGFVGSPALVIGGGISAAEAVIAISNAKTKANDPTAVYWSYRGDKLPRVAESKALGPSFYDAYVGNGNIRYLPNSESAAVFAGPDQRDYLLVRVDRKVIEGRPIETVHLEFAKEQVLACLGGDLPFQLVENLGAKVPTVNDKRYMLVNQAGELSLPGVFLIGNARGAKYLRCDAFDDQGTYTWIMSSRNIKVAMWEGVMAVETIAVRAGNQAAKMALLAAPALQSKPLEPAAKAPAAAKAAPAAPPRPAAAAPRSVVPPAAADPAAARHAAAGAQLESLLPDGTVDAEFPLDKPTTTIGRSGADISTANDVRLSTLHASVLRRGDDFVLEDGGSSSGTWLRVQGTEGQTLQHGDFVWVGSQSLMATKTADGWALRHYDGQGVFKASYPIGERGLFIGRGAGEPLDESDTSLSRRHAQFRVDAQGLRVFDLNSKNGTLVKLSAPFILHDGDEFRVGSQRYRFERFEPEAKLRPTDVVVDAPPAPAPAGAAAAAPAAGGAATVTLQHDQHPASFPVAAGQDVLNAYFAYLDKSHPGSDHGDFHKKPLDWSCLAGTCGLCVVKVAAGAENFEPVGAGSPELDTLENKAFVDPDPKQYRLACKAKLKGPVTLTIVE